MERNNKKTKKADLICNFCDKINRENPTLAFYGDAKNVKKAICSQCINFYSFANKFTMESLLTTESFTAPKKDKLPMPREIYEYLNRDIIKQDDAKRAIANAVAHHYCRIRDPLIGKSNILLIGKTGTGKTEIVRSVAKFLNVPFAIVDASSFTAKGYIGEDADTAIKRLLIAADGDVRAAENGIIFIDEVDKIARREGSDSGVVGTTSVQQQLLKVLEGDKIQIKIPLSDGKEQFVLVDTSKILFICSGAFVGLEDIINKGSSARKPLGIQASFVDKALVPQINPLKKVEPAHLEKYGLIPEFLGRLPVITSTEPLNVEDLIRILQEPQNSVTKQYQRLMSQYSIELEFSNDFLKEVATEAHQKQIGARGLRQVIESKMQKMFFDVDKYESKKIQIGSGGSIQFLGESVITQVSPLVLTTEKSAALASAK